MTGRARLNKQAILQNLPYACLGALTFASVGGIFAGAVVLISTPPEVIPVLQSHKSIPGDPGTYEISGTGQVEVKQGDYIYTFNFEAQQVLIDGDKTLDAIDFKEFSNPAMIADVNAKGCTLGASYLAASAAYLASPERSGDYDGWVNRDRTTAQALIKNYCPP